LYRNPRWKPTGSGFPSAVTGDRSATSVGLQRPRSRIQKFAERLKRNPTPAEREFTRILNSVDRGKLHDTFTCQRRVGRKWILDVFFFKQRLGIEIDGGYHSGAKQRCVDTLKARACEEAGVTLIRITNNEVFGSQEVLLKKMREGLLRALLRGKSQTAGRAASGAGRETQ
jgi:very-short-patch-repair endonuclease